MCIVELAKKIQVGFSTRCDPIELFGQPNSYPQAGVHVVARLGHNLAAKPPPPKTMQDVTRTVSKRSHDFHSGHVSSVDTRNQHTVLLPRVRGCVCVCVCVCLPPGAFLK